MIWIVEINGSGMNNKESHIVPVYSEEDDEKEVVRYARQFAENYGLSNSEWQPLIKIHPYDLAECVKNGGGLIGYTKESE